MPAPVDLARREGWLKQQRRPKGPQSPTHRINILESRMRMTLTDRRKVEIIFDAIFVKGYQPKGNEFEQVFGKSIDAWLDGLLEREKDYVKGLVGHYIVYAIARSFDKKAKRHFNAPEGQHKPDVFFHYKNYCVAIEVKYYERTPRLGSRHRVEEEFFQRFESKRYDNCTKMCVIFSNETFFDWLDSVAEEFQGRKISICPIPLRPLDTTIYRLTKSKRYVLYLKPMAREWIQPYVEQSHKHLGKFFKDKFKDESLKTVLASH